MARGKYDDATRERALQLYQDEGGPAAAAATGVPLGTVKSWARRAGVSHDPGPRRQAVEAAQLTLAQRRAQLAEGLLDDALALRLQLFAPTVLHHAGGGGDRGPQWITLDVDQPTFAGQLEIARTMDVVVRNLQLLTGEATDRNEQVQGLDLEAELRTYQLGLADGADKSNSDRSPATAGTEQEAST